MTYRPTPTFVAEQPGERPEAASAGDLVLGLDWSAWAQPRGFALFQAVGNLLWPDFVEIDGCVLLAQRYQQDTFEEWRAALGNDRRRLETTLNHVHLYDLFAADATGASLDELERAARILRATWVLALRERFPSRRFRFAQTTEPDDYGPTITFWQA